MLLRKGIKIKMKDEDVLTLELHLEVILIAI